MGFSATGDLLTGSVQRPDTTTLIILNSDGWSSSTDITSTNCKLNRYGYRPIVSTITGLGRALLGIVHTIVHLVCAIFSKNREHYLQEASLGAKNIGRGVVEAIPVIGNITMFVIDLLRMNKYEKVAKKHFEMNKAAYDKHIVMFIYGKEIAKRPIAEVNAEINKLNRKPTRADIEKIIRNKN